MPWVTDSSYRAPWWLPGGHAQTIFPSLCRRLPALSFERTRLATPDGDRFLLDWHRAGPRPAGTVAVLSHGLEGHSRRIYMRGMCLAFAGQGWDSAARNFRSCGGEMNRTPRMYHSGQTDDLHTVVRHCLERGYRKILLVGFSMGGNQTLKYLGEAPERVPDAVKGAVVFSVPCHLPGAAKQLDQPGNAVYMRYFLRTLRQKVRQKRALYPDLYPLDGLDAMRTFAEFDNAYTAPVHGFASGRDYWEQASCLPHLHRIKVPTLLVNAVNDPFLSAECFPVSIAERSSHLTLEAPREGGHVGFAGSGKSSLYWSENRAVTFFQSM